jgi:WD40 repeat protein
VFRVQWSPTGDSLLTSTDSSRTVSLYVVTGRNTVQQWLAGHQVEIGNVVAHPSQDRIVTTGYNKLISWDVGAARPSPVTLGDNPGAVTALAYSPDGSLLAAANAFGTDPRSITIRDAKTGRISGRLSGAQRLNALVFDPTNQRLAAGDLAGNVCVWDVPTGRQVRQFAIGSDIRAVFFSSDGGHLITHGENSALIFDLESGELTRESIVGGSGIRELAVDRQRSRIIVGCKNGTLASLSIPDLTLETRVENAHDGSVECLALSPDGRLLVSGGSDHRVILRDAKSFDVLLEFPLWIGNVRDLTFDYKGRRLFVVGTDCNVDLWNIAALYYGLEQIGLAWDRSAPAAITAPSLSPDDDPSQSDVPIIRRPETDEQGSKSNNRADYAGVTR